MVEIGETKMMHGFVGSKTCYKIVISAVSLTQHVETNTVIIMISLIDC